MRGTYGYPVDTALRGLFDVLHGMARELLKVGGDEVEGHGGVEGRGARPRDDACEEVAEGVLERDVVAGAALHLTAGETVSSEPSSVCANKASKKRRWVRVVRTLRTLFKLAAILPTTPGSLAESKRRCDGRPQGERSQEDEEQGDRPRDIRRAAGQGPSKDGRPSTAMAAVQASFRNSIVSDLSPPYGNVF